MKNNVEKTYQLWVDSLKDFPEYYEELVSIKDNKVEIEDRFYKDLKFGTAGLRGIMALGTNRMNFFTVGRTTQGLCEYMLSKNPSPKVVIGYDSRNFSKEFAEHAASIFAANGCKAYIFPTLVPTPVLGFATKTLKCDYGVMITASHNPAIYNGYKVFNQKACQIDDDIADDILEFIEKVDIFNDVKKISLSDGLNKKAIEYVDPSVINLYFEAVQKASLRPEICKDAGIKLTYTPLNGTGNLFVREMFKRLGITDVNIVKEQEMPDGNFPTCPYPNPEFKEALELGLKLAQETQSDALLATDPDADRLAISVLSNGSYQTLTGNQLATLLIDYIAKTRKEIGNMPNKPIALRSIVSSKLFDRVADSYGVSVAAVLTGFKFIGEYIDKLEKQGEEEDFILGFEEACGFLIGTHVRDKDAVVTSTLVAEMLCHFKIEGKTAIDVLDEIYKKHGYYSDMAQNIAFEGPTGMDEMNSIMSNLRNNPPKDIVGHKIVTYIDYLTLEQKENGHISKLTNRPSNVLEYRMDDGCSVIIRPSGTEPKLKIYYALPGKTQQQVDQLEKEYARASIQLVGYEQ